MLFKGYLLLINLVGLIIFGVDKAKAIKEKYRIPEKTLFIIAILGGSVGCILGMVLFRHKTKKVLFIVGMPLILIIEVYLLGQVL